MPQYAIGVTEEAKTDLQYYSAFERKIIAGEVRLQLSHQPLVVTKKRRKLRDNPIASWELRCGKHRVFYRVDEALRKVTVIAVGHKQHNVLLVRGKEVRI